MTPIAFRILGAPFSKANSRKIVDIPIKGTDRTRSGVIKSKEALAYERDALMQIPGWARQRIDVPVRITLRIFYTTERPDLDESLVLDILQDRYQGSGKERVLVQRGVYTNDRLVREKHVYWGIDKANPRTEVCVEPLVPVQADMLAPDIGTMLKPLPAVDTDAEGVAPF